MDMCDVLETAHAAGHAHYGVSGDIATDSIDGHDSALLIRCADYFSRVTCFARSLLGHSFRGKPESRLIFIHAGCVFSRPMAAHMMEMSKDFNRFGLGFCFLGLDIIRAARSFFA